MKERDVTVAAPKLKTDHKRFLVRCFARYFGATEARDALKLQYGIEVTVQTATLYNPESPACDGLRPDLQALFADERKRHLEDIDSIPIAHRAIRLRRLEDAYHLENKRGNTVGIRDTIEQARKESDEAGGEAGAAVKVYIGVDVNQV